MTEDNLKNTPIEERWKHCMILRKQGGMTAMFALIVELIDRYVDGILLCQFEFGSTTVRYNLLLHAGFILTTITLAHIL